MRPHAYIWEFEVRPERAAEFELYYGPNGSWVQLFRTARGYLETVLLRDLVRPHRFVTIDRWESERAYQDFRAAREEEFAALDSRCEAFTTAERELGRFDIVSSQAA